VFPLASLAVCLAVLPPSSFPPAQELNIRGWEKVLDFIATAENISVINIPLLLIPKHSSY